MKADTDQLIAQAIAALPYRRPRAGFAARVMTEIAPAPAPAWYMALLKPAELLIAAWGALVGFGAATLAWQNSAGIAAALIQPGGPLHLAHLAGAYAALGVSKFVYAVSYAGGLLPSLPAVHDTVIATLACSLIIAGLARGGRAAHARAGI